MTTSVQKTSVPTIKNLSSFERILGEYRGGQKSKNNQYDVTLLRGGPRKWNYRSNLTSPPAHFPFLIRTRDILFESLFESSLSVSGLLILAWSTL